MITTTTTYNWNIANLERYAEDEIVYTIHWTLSASEGEYSASSYGSLGLERPEDEIIPYEELTKELVIEWIKDKLGEEAVTSMETALQSQIDEQKVPSKLSGIPWNS